MSTPDPVSLAPSPTPKRKGGTTPTIATTIVIAIIPACAVLNILGGYIHTAFHLPVYIDAIGTAVAAILLGPWRGALTGVITNLVLALIAGPTYLAFLIVNVVAGLVWGYGVHSWKLGRTLPRFFLLNIIVSLVTTVVSAPITILVFGGATGSGQDTVTAVFIATGQALLVSVLSSSLLTGLADKIIAGFVALAIIEALPASLTHGLNLVKASPAKGVLYSLGGVLIGVVFIAGYYIWSAAVK